MKSNKLKKIKFMPEPITIPAAKVRTRWGTILDEARYLHQPYLVTKKNEPTAMIMGFEDYENMQDMMDTMAEQLDPKFQEDLKKSHEAYRKGKVGTKNDIEKILKAKMKYAKQDI